MKLFFWLHNQYYTMSWNHKIFWLEKNAFFNRNLIEIGNFFPEKKNENKNHVSAKFLHLPRKFVWLITKIYSASLRVNNMIRFLWKMKIVNKISYTEYLVRRESTKSKIREIFLFNLMYMYYTKTQLTTPIKGLQKM